MDYKNSPKLANKFVCEKCDYKCSKQSDFDKHLLTLKHKNDDADYVLDDAKFAIQYSCECGKEYKHRQGLWKHKQKCQNKEPEIIKNEKTDKDELIKYLIKENSEFKDMLMEQNKMVMKICEKSMDSNKTINNTNTNCNNINNNSFNLQFFLNETCKDALNISEFVDSIKVQLTDLETVGQAGYVEGVSKILIKNLNELDTCKRPIHCSDVKREVLYIKDDDKWLKEDDEKLIIKKAIKDVSNKNIRQITEWANMNPDCKQSDSRKNDQYLKIVMNSMSGGSNEEQTTNMNKIIRNITKSVIIEK
jgi:hypothetical protein